MARHVLGLEIDRGRYLDRVDPDDVEVVVLYAAPSGAREDVSPFVDPFAELHVAKPHLFEELASERLLVGLAVLDAAAGADPPLRARPLPPHHQRTAVEVDEEGPDGGAGQRL